MRRNKRTSNGYQHRPCDRSNDEVFSEGEKFRPTIIDTELASQNNLEIKLVSEA